jgi:Zn-dependent M28 family amino/carboxypeptidase
VYIEKSAFADIFDLSSKKLTSLINKIGSKGTPKPLEREQKVRLDIIGQDIPMVSSNILAAIPGSDLKEEWIILTAHYDHIGTSGDLIYNGADDNASGVTAVLEIAEAFKKAKDDGFSPKRSILFMLVSGEEKGLLGSEYYTRHPVYSFEKTMVNLNIDMIGRRDENHKESNNYVYLIGADKLSSELHEISENVNKTYSQLEIDYTYNDDDDPNRFYYRSDQYNFAKNNIPVIFYFNGTHQDYHKPTDTPDKIELDALQKRAQLVFYTAWVLAEKDDMLELD